MYSPKIRKDLITPLARKIARLVNKFQGSSKRPEYLLLKVRDFGHFVNAYRLYEKEMKNVQPEDPRGSSPEDLSSGEKRQSRHDQVGQPGNRRGSATRRRTRRPRNRRKRFQKGAK